EIVLHDGMILDGRNRYRACRAAGVEPRYRNFEGNDPAAFVISVNIRRRHLTDQEKREALAQLVAAHPEKSDRAIAKEAGVSHTHVANVRKEAEATGIVLPVEERVGADKKKRKQPKRPTKAQKAERAERRRTRKTEIARNRERAIMAQLPDDIYDLLDEAGDAADEVRGPTVRVGEARAEEVVNHVEAEALARACVSAWTRLADGIRKKGSPVGNDVDPQASAEAMKAAHAQAKRASPAPVAKKRGRPPGSKNKKKAA